MKEQATSPSAVDSQMQRIAQHAHILSLRSGKSKEQVMIEALQTFDMVLSAQEQAFAAGEELPAKDFNGEVTH